MLSDPATAASVVALAVYDLEVGGAPSHWKGMHGPINLAAACMLGPADRAALKDCADDTSSQVVTVGEVGGGGGGEGGEERPRLISEFGEISDAAVRQSLVSFDNAAGWYLIKHLPMARRIHRDLTYEMYNGLGGA